MAVFDIRSAGPVAFDWVEEKSAYKITGSADASGEPIGDQASFTTEEWASPDYTTGVNHVDGHAVVKASSGDEVHIHYFGDSPAPDMTTGNFADDLRFEITGGTGQFDSASGSGRLTAHGNINENPCVVSSHLEGSIEVPALQS